MKHKEAIIYKPNPEAYRSSYGYENFEGNNNLYLAITLVVTVGVILAWWSYKISIM